MLPRASCSKAIPKRAAGRPPRRLSLEALEDRLVLSGDVVIQWNQTLLDAVRADKTPPPAAARTMAMVQAAVYDAVNAIDQVGTPYHASVHTPAGASPVAAAAEAAYEVLVHAYPSQKGRFDAALASSLGTVTAGPSEDQGVAVGRNVADQILAWRADDGSTAAAPYTPGSGPGQWQPTAPGFKPALLPQWAHLTPFAMTGDSQFRPAGPPALTSAAYTASLNEVKDFGSANSTFRSADQTQIAHFWDDGSGTATPPGHWNTIAEGVSLAKGLTLDENARLFALLDIALADAGIAAWDAKYADNLWRPITAIQNAGQDDNPGTTADPQWAPLLTTPPFPTYVSGHSTFSGAAAAVLASFFGTDDVRFSAGSDSLPGVTRSFASFSAAAAEAGQSRVYGGIHYQFDNQDGLATGKALGTYVSQNILAPRAPAPQGECMERCAAAAPELATPGASTPTADSQFPFVNFNAILVTWENEAGQNAVNVPPVSPTPSAPAPSAGTPASSVSAPVANRQFPAFDFLLSH